MTRARRIPMESMMLKFTRSTLLACLMGLSPLVHAQAPAANFPTKPIRVIVPFAPGGNVDVTARVVSTAMSRVLGQSVVVDRKSTRLNSSHT